jgi:hypothetical protein
LILLLILACTGDRRLADSSVTSESGASRPSGSMDSAAWFERQRTIDFSGDGVPDTVRLRALGSNADSLRIALTFVSGGVERWSEEWASGYELVDPPPLPDGPARAEYVRKRLDRALASVMVEPFDSSDYATMADPVDSAILRRPPPRQVVFAYGYETTVVLAWDAESGRLRRLHSCC